MGDVVDIRSKKPHLSGGASCLACKHTWQAVAELGVNDLECPSCGLLRGVWSYPIHPAEGSSVVTCVHCQGEHWHVEMCEDTKEGHRRFAMHCIRCGNAFDMINLYDG